MAHTEGPSPLEAPAADIDVTALLRAWSDGDQDALQALTPIVYGELHRLARHYMTRERSGHSLQAIALVNEAYMRLADYRRMQWQDRAHFFAVSAQVMRRILVDYARRHNIKRGRGVRHVPLDDVAVVTGGEDPETDLVALDEALSFLGLRADVADLMPDFDVYALSSTTEGFSIACIEAMACGVPVVATRSGGPEEIIEQGRSGLLVPVNDPASLADAIERIAMDPALAEQLAEHGLARVHTRFTLSAMLASYATLFEQVARNSRGRAAATTA